MAQLGDLAHAKTRLRKAARFAGKRPWPAQGAVSAQAQQRPVGCSPRDVHLHRASLIVESCSPATHLELAVHTEQSTYSRDQCPSL
jgi:hypothetical protein